MRLKVNRGTLRLILVTFFAAWILRVAVAWLTGCFHNFDRRDVERLAIALAQTGTYSNLLVPGLPSAGEAPAYVFFLAGIFKLFGTGALAETIKVLACRQPAVCGAA